MLHFKKIRSILEAMNKTCWERWGQEEKGTTEDEMAGWHHWLDGRESEWTAGVDDGQGGLACCDSWGHIESDTTEPVNWAELNWMNIMVNSLTRSHACNAKDRAPNPAAVHHQPTPSPETPGHPQASLLWGHCSFLLGPSAQGSVEPSKNLFPRPM